MTGLNYMGPKNAGALLDFLYDVSAEVRWRLARACWRLARAVCSLARWLDLVLAERIETLGYVLEADFCYCTDLDRPDREGHRPHGVDEWTL